MALINCPECNKEFSEYAKVCPNCGCPIDIVIKNIKINESDKTENDKTDVKNTIIKIISEYSEPM